MIRATNTGRELEAVEEYVADVLAGRVVVGRLVRLAVERHVQDLARAAAGWEWYFDRDEAALAIRFCQLLKHSKGEWAGRPLILAPWQAFQVASVFGWKRATDGVRRFRAWYCEIARKNGKSTLAAAVALKLLVADGEHGAEVYAAATKTAQARIVHSEARRMARKSPALSRLLTFTSDCLAVERTESRFATLCADAETQDGLNISGAIVDELHAHPTRDLWDVIETATGSRRQPLLLAITTAGDGEDRASICWELRDYSIKVLEGIVDDDRWFAYIAALDEAEYDEEGHEVRPGDAWDDEAAWIKANPNLGVSVKLEDLRAKAKKAGQTPTAQNNFRRKHLNQWVTTSAAWLPPGLWNAAPGGEWYGTPDRSTRPAAIAGLRPEILEAWRGSRCWIGGDLSSVSDLTSAVVARRADDGAIELLALAWCPRDNAVGRQRDRRAPYLTWADLGQLELTEGNSVDYDRVREVLRWLRDEAGLDVEEIALDPHNARYLATRLEEEDGFRVVEHRQGYLSMSPAIKETERLLLDRKIRHGNHKPLAWCVSNAIARHDPAGNIKLDKERSREKIDLAVAAVMAIGRASAAIEDASPYRERGILFL